MTGLRPGQLPMWSISETADMKHTEIVRCHLERGRVDHVTLLNDSFPPTLFGGKND